MTGSALIGAVVLTSVLFALLYFPAVTKLSRSLASPYPKADVWRRSFAANIDCLLVITVWPLYIHSEAMGFVLAAAAYLLVRDGIRGQSLGKFFLGLVVIDLMTGRPCSLARSVRRNVVFLLPGVNVVAAFLEAITVVRDPQGQRLGDRLAQTQVVEGLGAIDLAASFVQWLRRVIVEIEDVIGRRPGRIG